MHAPSQEIGPTGATSELWGLLMQDFYRLDYVTFVSGQPLINEYDDDDDE